MVMCLLFVVVGGVALRVFVRAVVGVCLLLRFAVALSCVCCCCAWWLLFVCVVLCVFVVVCVCCCCCV